MYNCIYIKHKLTEDRGNFGGVTMIRKRDGDPGAWRWENSIAMRDDFYLTKQITSRRPYNIKRCLHISHLISGRYDVGISCRHTHVNV